MLAKICQPIGVVVLRVIIVTLLKTAWPIGFGLPVDLAVRAPPRPAFAKGIIRRRLNESVGADSDWLK